MDNITHTLIGALVAETAARIIPVTRSVLPATTRRNLYMTLMVVGSNLPDLDFIYSGITGGTLGYLLHHRGHTHTVVSAIVMAALMYVATVLWLRWRHTPSTPTDKRWLALMALLGPLLHLSMDFTNEYGVHPFWPFNNDWLYGDAIFIVEPLFWAAAAPLVFLLHGRIARGLMAVVLLIAIALSFGSGLVPLPMAVSLTLLTAALLTVAWRASANVAAATGLAVTVGIVCMFVFTSHLANRQVATLATAQFPDAEIVDQILSPLPVNPLCWEVILVQLEEDKYTLREAMLGLAPAWFTAEQCSAYAMNATTTAVLTKASAIDDAALAWHGEMTMSLSEMKDVVNNNCEAAAFTQFARALWVMRDAAGWLIGDLRYDREPGLGFAELALTTPPQQCPRNLPPWTPPRGDVLGSTTDGR